MVALDRWGDERYFMVSEGWTTAQAKSYANSVGTRPLYIVNIKDKRYA